jgi:hypothetical protein
VCERVEGCRPCSDIVPIACCLCVAFVTSL